MCKYLLTILAFFVLSSTAYGLPIVGDLDVEGNASVSGSFTTEARDQYYYVVDSGGTYTTVMSALTAAETTGGTVWLRHTGASANTDYAVTTDTVASNVVLKVDKGARITIASGQTLTINGFIEAGAWQIFVDADSTNYDGVQFGSGYIPVGVLPEWWGATASNLTADATVNHASIQRAVNAIAAIDKPRTGYDFDMGGAVVQLSAGVYCINSDIELPCGITIRGVGDNEDWNMDSLSGTNIMQTANYSIFKCQAPTADTFHQIFKFESLTLLSNLSTAPSSTTAAIWCSRGSALTYGHMILKLNDVVISGVSKTLKGFYYGIYMFGNMTRMYLTDCVIMHTEADGIHINDNEGGTASEPDGAKLIHTSIIGTGSNGVYSEGLTLTLIECETYNCGIDAVTATEFYAVNAEVVHILGGFYNNDWNEIKMASGSISGAVISYAGDMDPVGAGAENNSTGKGVTAYNAGTQSATVSIMGTTFWGNSGDNVYCGEGGTDSPTTITVVGCDIYGGGGYSIHLASPSSGYNYAEISNNHIHGNGTDGVYLDGTYVIMTGNIIYQNTTEPGVYFGSGIGGVVSGNSITNDGGDAVTYTSGNTLIVSGNKTNGTVNGSGGEPFIMRSGLVQNTVTLTGSSDSTNVAGVNVIALNTVSGNITVGAFIGGSVGQVLQVVKTTNGNTAKLEHNKGTANQNIFLSSTADESIVSKWGGWTLVCITGGYWIEAGQ